MRKQFTTKLTALVLAGVLAIGGATVVAGGGSDSTKRPAGTTATGPPAQVTATRSAPDSVRTVESAAEDIVDKALVGDRVAVVRKAEELKTAADGAAADDLRAAGVPEAQISQLQTRAATVARLAPSAPLLEVALASNHAFELVPGFFGAFDERVPADVIKLDYFDFEAKLRAKAGELAAVNRAVRGLDTTWRTLRPGLVGNGGQDAAAAFDRHLTAMKRLVRDGDTNALQDEAQKGLDLVDKLEAVYTG